MKKIKFNVGADAANAELDQSSFYDGDVPPRGVYRVKVKRLAMKENKNGDPMINGIAEIAETKKSGKDKYNGYGIWFNQNVTKQVAPYVNNFLDALGFNKKAFWGAGGVTVDENEDPALITKIGTKTVGDEITARLRTKRGKWDGEDRLEVAGAGWLPLSAGDEDEEKWEEEESATDAEDEAADEAAEDEDEDEDEESDEEEEGDEDEEGEEEEGFAREDLDGYDRAGVKELLKEWAPEFKVLKRHTDDELRDAVWEAMNADDEEEDEDGPAPF